jgi:glutaredoxin
LSERTQSTTESRPELSVYWQPGCSSCLKTKEFLTELGYEFESVNVLERAEALGELSAAGFRGVPVVRKGATYIYAQSLDDVAALVGTTRADKRLPPDELATRWDEVLNKAHQVIESFDTDTLDREVIPSRPRSVRQLCAHVFQIVESFLTQLEDDTIDARAIYLDPRDDLKTRQQLIDYISSTHVAYREWLSGNGYAAMPDQLRTYYGLQPSTIVLERSVWHATQHVRQLDHVAAGIGEELRVPDSLYAGLPLPQRLWA